MMIFFLTLLSDQEIDLWVVECVQYVWEEGRDKDALQEIRKYIKLLFASPELFPFLVPYLGCQARRRSEGEENSSIYEYYYL